MSTEGIARRREAWTRQLRAQGRSEPPWCVIEPAESEASL